MGEYPVGVLSEEIETPGDGQIRGLVTLAGNPVLSTPNSERLAGALDQLDFMVSIDLYLNETTRHADVILPPPSQLQRGHYDLLLLQFAVRNVANYSPPVLPLDEGQPDEWEIICEVDGHRAGPRRRRGPGGRRRPGDLGVGAQRGEGRVLAGGRSGRRRTSRRTERGRATWP